MNKDADIKRKDGSRKANYLCPNRKCGKIVKARWANCPRCRTEMICLGDRMRMPRKEKLKGILKKVEDKSLTKKQVFDTVWRRKKKTGDNYRPPMSRRRLRLIAEEHRKSLEKLYGRQHLEQQTV